MKKKKSGLSTFLLILIFLAGLSLLLYPSIANYWNSLHQSQAIAAYAEKIAGLDEDVYEELLQDARDYNSHIPERQNVFTLDELERESYNNLLNFSGVGVMGYIEIPTIDVSLPVYHGTDDAVLQSAVGHVEWTSLPVGGLSTHCVLSGHRGLPSAKLFTSLDRLAVGDTFMLRVLDEVLTYEVDQILIVEPDKVSDLVIVDGKDYCTLVTCTPYGINTHRMLVRGHRIENTPEAITMHITAEAMQIDEIIVAPVLAAPILLILLLIVLFKPQKKKKDWSDSL